MNNFNEYMSELTWSLDEMLIKAKEKPMSIHHDYETRFRIWSEEILSGRHQAIIGLNGDPEYINRMIALVINDYDRLCNRIRKEFTINEDIDQYRKRSNELFIVTTETIKVYEGEIKND